MFSFIDDGCCCGSCMSANSSSVGVSVEGVCLSSCSRDVIADDVHAFNFSIGILILLLLNITFILAGEMLCTFVISSKNSAPKLPEGY